MTATSEAAGAATGLRVADNVVLRKEGALMPRPVFASSALSRTYRAAFPYKGSLYYIGPSNAVYSPSQALLTFTYSATTGSNASNSPDAVRADIASMKEARGNLYVATSEGAYKVTSTSDTTLYRAGATPTDVAVGAISATIGGSLLPTNTQVAYRVVVVLTDPNGLVIRSRPSGATLVSNTSGSTAQGQLSIYARALSASYAATKRQLEVYRTRVFPTSATVDDEMQLVGTIDVGLGAGISSLVDNVADTARGTTLYTSPSRGGIESANDRPPGAACIERFRGSLFFGNTVGPQRVVISYNGAVVTGLATGIGVRQYTGNTSIGSNTITGLSSTVGLRVGQTVLPTGSTGFMGAITSIVGTTVTTTTNATVALAAGAISFYDAVSIDGDAANSFRLGWTAQSPTSAYAFAYFNMAGTYQVYEQTPPLPGYAWTVVIERVARGGAPFQLRASRGDEMSPAVPLSTANPGLSSTNDVYPNGLVWSEPDEPEHCPPKNFARVGDTGKGILALVATKDRLLIFKEDGLFMLTGDTAKNFAIYPLDTTCLCILPGSVRRLKNTVFLLTNLGLCAVDENGGVSVVSRPIQLEVASIVNAIRAAQKSSGLYNMPGLVGHTGSSDDAQGEYHLALGSSTPSFGGQVLVYSLPRDGFTTFTFTTAPVALATDGEGNPLVLTSSALLTPTTTLGTIAARVSPRAFADPALLGKFWTHVLAGFSQLTGTTNVQAKFTSSASMVAGASITESFDLPIDAGTSLLQFPLGSLLRHPVPAAVRRAYMLFVELLINVSNGSFTLETIAAESRENISNKEPTHGSGST